MNGFTGGQDGLTIARLSGHLPFVLHRRWPHEEAVRSVRALAADRADLLAQWAGILLGANDPHRGDWPEVTAQIQLLVDAGAQVDAIPGWALIGRARQGAWAAANWPPVPGLADALGGPVEQAPLPSRRPRKGDTWPPGPVWPSAPCSRYGLGGVAAGLGAPPDR